MIIYDLQCENEHHFEGWFKDSADLDFQKNKGLLRCPICNSEQVQKKLTASKVGKKSNAASTVKAHHTSMVENSGMNPEDYKTVQSMLAKVHSYIGENFTDVGNRFADVAMQIHRGEKDAENIYGTATKSQLKELAEEGVKALPLPPKPIEKNKLN